MLDGLQIGHGGGLAHPGCPEKQKKKSIELWIHGIAGLI
jgi:hypothetical protein